MKTLAVASLLISAGSLLYSQKNSSVASLTLLKSEIEHLKKDSDLTHASWSFCAMQTTTGKIITEYNSQLSLTPASTQKIITTAAGLCILGPSFTYQTKLEYDGTYDSIHGIINGNLYIRGSGDPTLQSVYFKNEKDTVPIAVKWAGILKSRGIRHIYGNIIADASVFEDETTESNWVWGDMGNYYGAGAFGLSYMDNMYSLFFNSGQQGDSTHITTIFPDLPGFKIVNHVISYGTEDEAYIYGEPYSNTRYVTGTIPPGKTNFEVKGSMPDPPLLLAIHLLNSLSSDSIKVNGNATTVHQLKLSGSSRGINCKKLLIHTSPSLDKIVYWTNMVSDNLFAEDLLKTIALYKTGFGSSAEGITELINFWKKKGINSKGLSLYDGCGLSRSNTVTTRQLTEMLREMTNEDCYIPFFNSLPVAGKSGTLKGLMKGTRAENNLRAKSGSFTRVRSFAGYVNSKSGSQIAFSIIANNFDCTSDEMRSKMERLMVLLAELD